METLWLVLVFVLAVWFTGLLRSWMRAGRRRSAARRCEAASRRCRALRRQVRAVQDEIRRRLPPA